MVNLGAKGNRGQSCSDNINENAAVGHVRLSDTQLDAILQHMDYQCEMP